jgi:hypothetical protein
MGAGASLRVAVKMFFSLHTLAHLACVAITHTLSVPGTLLPLLFFAAAHTYPDKNSSSVTNTFFLLFGHKSRELISDHRRLPQPLYAKDLLFISSNGWNR